MSDKAPTREEQNKTFQTPPPPAKTSQTYEVPAEVVPLPSCGKVYPPDHPLHNETTIEIKAMTANEEDLLTSQALIKNGTVISKLLDACILNRLVNSNSMVTGDRNAVLFALRISGYGPEYDVKISCPRCKEDFEHSFDLSALLVKSLRDEPVTPHTNIFQYQLPRSKQLVYFKLLTGADELSLSRAATGRKKVSKQIEQNVTSRLMHSIIAIGDEKDPHKLAKAVKNMPVADSRALRRHIEKIEPGINMKQSLECEFCGETSEVRVPLGLTFFWPDASQ